MFYRINFAQAQKSHNGTKLPGDEKVYRKCSLYAWRRVKYLFIFCFLLHSWSVYDCNSWKYSSNHGSIFVSSLSGVVPSILNIILIITVILIIKKIVIIQSTPDNSKQYRFPVDFVHTFTVILSLVTRTLDNSNLPLTRTDLHFPSGHFLYNFTLDNSNHVFQNVTSEKIHYWRSKHWIYLKQPIASTLPFSPVQDHLQFTLISSSFAA